MNDFDLFERKFPTSSSSELIEGEAHVKLKRNLHLALDRHEQIMRDELQEMPQQAKRLIAEVATATVKAALTTDRTALKARQDNSLERVFLRVLFHRKRLGYALSEKEAERLRSASRAEIEASLGPRQLAEYDAMEF